mgnify:FL=1|jgi:hypothetical protein
MFLDKEALNEVLLNKNAMVIVGKLSDDDRKNIKSILYKYNNKKNYVGQAHIEGCFFKDMSKGLKSYFKLEKPTTVMFFKNGFLEHKREAESEETIFRSEKDIQRLVYDRLEIYI